jgi:hypothetical protein
MKVGAQRLAYCADVIKRFALFGSYFETSSAWRQGVFTSLKSETLCSVVSQIVVSLVRWIATEQTASCWAGAQRACWYPPIKYLFYFGAKTL